MVSHSVIFSGTAPTLFPPVPSITFPVLVSITLAWNHPPSALSSTLPRPPHIVTASTQKSCSFGPHLFPPSSPALLPNALPRIPVSIVQKGRRTTEVIAMTKAPPKPARVPVKETPPLVPGGTCRKFQEVRSRGLLLDKMPSSDEKVSAATAA